jgi:membrane protein required for colicin V production
MNVVDIAILAVLLLSALAAFSRGFVREVLAVGSWIAAIFAVIYLLAPARPFLRQYITYPLLADGITGAVIFVATLAVCTTLASYLSRNIRGGALGAVDRSLGLLFGLARGVILVCLAYMLMIWVMPQDKDRPAWLQQARSLPMVASAANGVATPWVIRMTQTQAPRPRFWPIERSSAPAERLSTAASARMTTIACSLATD